MLALDSFASLELNDILTIEQAAVSALSSGGSVVSWSAAGSSVSKLVDGKPSEILKACDYAKRLKWPHIYGQLRTRTRVAFGQYNDYGIPSA
jgi:hypothetical protein